MSHVLTLDDFEEAPWRIRAWYWVRRTWRKLRHLGRASPDDEEYESLHHALDEEGGDLLSPSGRQYDSLASFPQGESFRYNRRSVTISVELLRSRDKNPQVLAWSLFAVYIGWGMWYFMALKHYSFRDALYMIINSLSAVSYGNFDPTTPAQQALTIIFLFVGVGWMGTFVGLIASRRLDFQDTVKSEWLQHQAENDGAPSHSGLMAAQLRAARLRFLYNIMRILVAMAVGTVVLAPLEHWSLGYAIFFSAEILVGAGWVDKMPQTQVGKWFVLFYAVVGSLLIYHALGDIAALPLAMRETRYEAEVLGQWGDALTEDKLRSLARRADEIASSKPHPPSLPGPNLPGVANVADVPGVASTLSDSLPVPAPVVSFNSPAMNGEEGKDDGPARLASGSSSVLNGSVHNGSVLGSSVGSNASGVSNGPVRKMSSSGGLQVTRDEFVLSNLLLLGKVDMTDVRESQKVFDHLDKDKRGILDEADVVKSVDYKQQGVRFRSYRKQMATGKPSSEKRPTMYHSPSKLSSGSGSGGGTVENSTKSSKGDL